MGGPKIFLANPAQCTLINDGRRSETKVAQDKTSSRWSGREMTRSEALAECAQRI